MNTNTGLLTGILVSITIGVSAQTQLTPSPKTTPPSVAPTNTTAPAPRIGNLTPGSSTPYTTPPVQQQTSPPPAANPPPFPAGPTYTTTPAKPAPFPPDPK
ncbi:MAG TPA: hypothetical protein VK808_09535 [Bacteroidia bacterium]|jgi:hypothetical protein|nr:hypothetical protein [Bacteroidia bacterium]